MQPNSMEVMTNVTLLFSSSKNALLLDYKFCPPTILQCPLMLQLICLTAKYSLLAGWQGHLEKSCSSISRSKWLAEIKLNGPSKRLGIAQPDLLYRL